MNVSEFSGLTSEQAERSALEHGVNRLTPKKENRFFSVVKHVLGEPMVIILLVAALIYFFNGQPGDGLFLSAAIILISAISLFQDARSRRALENLKAYSQPVCKVVRDGAVKAIKSEAVVVGDSLIAGEGELVVADGEIIRANDFSVNESILTGEAFPVFKDQHSKDNTVFAGTTVSSGLAVVKVTAIGDFTKLGHIGRSLEEISTERTPLEMQIRRFVKKMVTGGIIVFLFVWGMNFVRSFDFTDSLLKALTLAMSILPEEIPVAFTTFMALGAWRLMKRGIVVKQMKTVETLGSATVICIDKTGTITQNRMALAKLYVFSSRSVAQVTADLPDDGKALLRDAMWASEPVPFDPMEIALHKAYSEIYGPDERPGFHMVHEYPLGGKPPMMTHIFENAAGQRIIAAKGAPEALISASTLSDGEKTIVLEKMLEFAGEGYRVLGVGTAEFSGIAWPGDQTQFGFRFSGLVAFYDPPKDNIGGVLQNFYQAGIDVKIITGDNAITTASIARNIGFRGYETSITGEELLGLNEKELADCVMHTSVFSRMFPEAKMKIVNALKKQGQVVAMTGDGVNDGPALKAAHIGIAMGKRGTEIARSAASLILIDDDLSKMVEAIEMGRKIYTNLKKAIRYIISIHIPIILTVFLPLALAWKYPNIFSPIHVIFLELIMGPTCSIIYENEPAEPGTMQRPPRAFSRDLFKWSELVISIVQGICIAAGVLFVYWYAVRAGLGERPTRAMVFTTLIVANIFLTLINRSFHYSVLFTLRVRNRLIPLIIFVTIFILALLLYVAPFSEFFGFVSLGPLQLSVCLATGFLCVTWIELVKFIRRKKSLHPVVG